MEKTQEAINVCWFKGPADFKVTSWQQVLIFGPFKQFSDDGTNISIALGTYWQLFCIVRNHLLEQEILQVTTKESSQSTARKGETQDKDVRATEIPVHHNHTLLRHPQEERKTSKCRSCVGEVVPTTYTDPSPVKNRAALETKSSQQKHERKSI